MHSKYTALESKSKDMIVQQNNAVSGATIALSDLGSRLSSLVDQLVASYSISEQEIEVSRWRTPIGSTDKAIIFTVELWFSLTAPVPIHFIHRSLNALTHFVFFFPFPIDLIFQFSLDLNINHVSF